MADTLAQLRLRAQQESDNVNQTFLDTAEWNTNINASYTELYGMIVQAFGNDYFVQSPSTGYTFTTTGLTQFYALPTDFFKLLGVDLQVPSPQQWLTLKPFNFSQRNDIGVYNSPIPQAGQTLRLFYVPRVVPLVADADTVDGVNGWTEYIVIDAAIKAAAKEESDVTVLLQRKQMILERITAEIENRNAADAATIANTRDRQPLLMRYRLNGNQLWLVGNSVTAWPYIGGWGDYGGGY